MLQENINNIVNEYILIISKLYPGRGDLFGINHDTLGNYDINNLNKVVIELKKIKEKMLNIDHSVYEKKFFYHILDLRIFEIECLREWENSCQFYLINGLGTVKDTFEYYVSPQIQLETAIKRIEYLDTYFEIAKKNLDINKISKYDCYVAIKESQMIWDELEVYIESKYLDKFRTIYESWILFLKNLCLNAKKLNNPYRIDSLKNYLEYRMGKKLDVKEQIDQIEKFLCETNVTDISKSKSCVKISKKEIEGFIVLIKDFGEQYFGFEQDILDTIEIIPQSTVFSRKLKTVGYIPKIGNNLKARFVFNDQYEYSREELLLAVIHEIYPGHHYLELVKDKQYKGKKVMTIFENRTFHEGWAKYCESFYVNYLLNNIEIKNLFNRKNYNNFAIAYASMRYHILNDNIEDIVKDLKKLTHLNDDIIKKIINTAFFYSVEKLDYCIGFLMFGDRLNNIPISKRNPYHIEILKSGLLF